MKLVSRQGVEHTHRFRALAASVAALPQDRLVLDARWRSSIGAGLALRVAARVDRSMIVATPPLFMGFDALLVDGQTSACSPLTERRTMLEQVIVDKLCMLPCAGSP